MYEKKRYLTGQGKIFLLKKIMRIIRPVYAHDSAN